MTEYVNAQFTISKHYMAFSTAEGTIAFKLMVQIPWEACAMTDKMGFAVKELFGCPSTEPGMWVQATCTPSV